MVNHIHCSGRWTGYELSSVRPHTLSPMFFVPKKPDGFRDILNLKIFNQLMCDPHAVQERDAALVRGGLGTRRPLVVAGLEGRLLARQDSFVVPSFSGVPPPGSVARLERAPFWSGFCPLDVCENVGAIGGAHESAAKGVDLNVYMDDLASRNPTMEGALQDIQIVCDILEEDGWVINMKKSVHPLVSFCQRTRTRCTRWCPCHGRRGAHCVLCVVWLCEKPTTFQRACWRRCWVLVAQRRWRFHTASWHCAACTRICEHARTGQLRSLFHRGPWRTFFG
jgi:hypothetical protein